MCVREEDMILDLMERNEGATLIELIAATSGEAKRAHAVIAALINRGHTMSNWARSALPRATS